MNNIKQYEEMAKLDLPDSERGQISSIADMLIKSFGELDKKDTSNIEPLVTVLDVQNVLREDICIKNISREELLANAPEQYDGYFQVPKTID